MFSVIIPIHNKLPHLERAINSVLNQTFGNFELILIDDASTDGSSVKLLEFEDKRIRRFRRETPGPGGYAARNLGIEEAKFPWIAFLDADDQWDLLYLEKIKNILDSSPQAQLVSTGWIEMHEPEHSTDQNSRDKAAILRRKSVFTLTDYLKDYKYIWTGSVCIQKELLERVGMFPAARNCKNGGDVDTWIRCLHSSKYNIYHPEVLSYYYKDTVNRVTDYKKNVSYTFCAYESVMEIYKSTQDRELKKELKSYVNRIIYNIQSRQLMNGMNYKLLSKMSLNGYSISRFVKLHIDYLRLSVFGGQ